MSQLHCTSKRKPGQHLTLEDRKMLEYLYNQNLKRPKKRRKSQKDIAFDLGWSEATLSRELKRGRILQLTSMLEEYFAYSAKVAQEEVEANWESKGPQLKIGADHKLSNTIEQMLLGEAVNGIEPLKYSPEAIVMYFDKEGWPTATRLCSRTIYNYIADDVF